MRKPRGDNQAKILAYIKQEIQEKGYPPSVREICEAVGLKSTSTVHGHLTRLEKKGLLHRDTMKIAPLTATPPFPFRWSATSPPASPSPPRKSWANR